MRPSLQGLSACRPLPPALPPRSATRTKATSARLASPRRASTLTLDIFAGRTPALAPTGPPWTRSIARPTSPRIARLAIPTSSWRMTRSRTGCTAKALLPRLTRSGTTAPSFASRTCSRPPCPSIATTPRQIGRQLGLAGRSSGAATTLPQVLVACPRTPRRSSVQSTTSTSSSARSSAAASSRARASRRLPPGTWSATWSSTSSSATTCA
mmetsp:Transcript_45366/g.145526  ORF Transcript_45366/g.145526 Transcript_45366/m.145526 type:complete len:211 (-) Transcript_45366:476-1108(-)